MGNKWYIGLIFPAVFAPATAISQDLTPGKPCPEPGRSPERTT